jgi:hypothetical protein
MLVDGREKGLTQISVWPIEIRGPIVAFFATAHGWLALVSICEIDVTSFSEDGRGVKWLCNKPYPYSNPNQINKKIQKETTLEIDQIS